MTSFQHLKPINWFLFHFLILNRKIKVFIQQKQLTQKDKDKRNFLNVQSSIPI